MAKFRKFHEENGRITWAFVCLGCGMEHAVWTGAGPGATWQFNGDPDKPTINPSLLVRMGPKCDPDTHLAIEGEKDRVCHSFIKDGNIQFLTDCTHHLAGQTVEIPDAEDWYKV